MVKRFAIGDAGGPLLGDFEDIQVVGDRVFLVTSAGVLVEAREGRDGETVPLVRRTRGLGGACEVEGLSWDEASSSMLLLCKQAQGKRWKDQLVILAVNPATGEFEPEPRLTVSHADLKRATGVKQFAGSAMVRYPRSGTWILLSGLAHAYAEIDTAGKVLAGGRLKPKRHRQPEGLAIAPDLTLLISDEAAGGPRRRSPAMRTAAMAAVVAVAFAATACSSALEPATPVPAPMPPRDSIEVAIFLIGDAGSKAYDGEPVLRELAIQSDSLRPVRQFVVFLGDNVYPRGVPPLEHPTREDAERRVAAQVLAIRKGVPRAC